MCENNQTNKSIAEILSIINILQQNADCPSDVCLETCDRGFLGCGTTTMLCNTRPVMLYTCCGNGTPWAMPISKDPEEATTSTIFRVEKVEDNCATFRVLIPNTEPTELPLIPYQATNSFFTMSLDCLCVLRCLQDTYVNLP